ncbi:MAG: hypothetical protein WCW26_04075 [Candidatus Buchananbacteria bacterium]
MTKRTIIIFSIFVSVAMVGSAFIFLYRQKTDILIDRYEKKLVICGNILEEKECFNNDFCEGIYQPACENCPELKFKSCQKVSDGMVKMINEQKAVCQKTAGKWYRNRLGNFCLCDQNSAGRTFDKNLGCINK